MNRVSLWRQSVGKGDDAVVFVHGNSLSSETFRHQISSSLSDRYRCSVIDLPGHGHSPWAEDASEYTTLAMIEPLIATLGEMNISRAVYVGHSMGGHILMQALERLPAPQGLAIFGAPPLGKPPRFERAFHVEHPILPVLSKADFNEDEIARVSVAFAPGDDEARKVIADAIRQADGRLRAPVITSPALPEYRDEIATLAGAGIPVAIFQGELDDLVRADYFSTFSLPHLWGDKIQIIPGAGHSPHLERPDVFNDLLLAFLGEIHSNGAID